MRNVLFVLMLMLGEAAQAQLSDFGEVDFHRADSIAALYEGESLENLPLLTHRLTSVLPSQLEQFRAIYTWVCINIYNDYGNYVRNRNKREKFQNDSKALAEWNAKFRSEVFQKLLNKQKTVCTGYAYLVREMATLAGINCKIIDGYGRTANVNIGEPAIPNHSWNAVQLNNRWYLCDPTWSSGYIEYPSFTNVHQYNDVYFLPDPELFVMNHFPLDSTWDLLDHSLSLTEFLHAPFIYKQTINHQMIPLEPKAMEVTVEKNGELILVFQAPGSINVDDIHLELWAGSNDHTAIPDIRRTAEGLLEVRHQFNRRIKYDVHLKLGEEYIATYKIKVRKNR